MIGGRPRLLLSSSPWYSFWPLQGNTPVWARQPVQTGSPLLLLPAAASGLWSSLGEPKGPFGTMRGSHWRVPWLCLSCLYSCLLCQAGTASSLSSGTWTSTLSSQSNTASNSVTSIPQMTSTNSKHMTSSNPGHTSTMVTQSLNPGPTGTTTTTKSGGLSTGTTTKTSTLGLRSLSSSNETQTSILTEVTTSKHSTSKSGSTLTSSSGDSTTSSNFSVGTSHPTTSQVSTTKPSTDSTSRNTGNTQDTQTSVTTEISMTSSPQKSSTVLTPTTSTQRLSTSSQNGHTESSTPQHTHITEVTTSTVSSSPSGSTPAQTGSKRSSSPDQTSNPFNSSASNSFPVTQEAHSTAPSMDSTSGDTGHTSPMVSQSSTSAITRVSMTHSPNVPSTKTTPITSPQELSTSSQNDHTGSSTSQPNLFTDVTTSTTSSSPSGSTSVQTGSQGSSSPKEITNPSTSSVSNSSSATLEVLSTAPSTESSQGSMTPEATQSSTSVPGLSMTSSPQKRSTVSTPIPSAQGVSTSSQNGHTGSTTPQTASLTEVTTSALSLSPSDQPLAQTVSQGTSSSGETTNPSTSSDSTSSPTTSEVLSTAPSMDSTSGNTGHTSPVVSQSLTSVITRVSMTNSPNVSSTETTLITSPQELSASSQNDHTGSSSPQTSSLTDLTTSIISFSPSSSTPVQTGSHGSSSPHKPTNPSTSSESISSPTTTKILTTAPSTHSTSGNTEHTSPMVSQSSTPVISTVSVTNSPNVSSTVTTAMTSTQGLSTSSQNNHTESSTPQPTHLPEVTMSVLSSSSFGPSLTQTGSQRTSSPDETTSSYAHTMSSSPSSTPSGEATSVYTGYTAAKITQSPSTATTQVLSTHLPQNLSTVSTPISSTQGMSTSQNNQMESMKTSSTPQPTFLTEVTTSTLLSSPSGSTPAQTGSQGSSSPDKTNNPSTSSVSNSSPATLEVLSTASSTESSPGSMTPEATQSSTSVPELSMTSSPQKPSTVLTPITSTQGVSTSSQNGHTGSTTPQTSSFPEVTTPTLSLSPSGQTLAQTGSQWSSSPDKTTKPPTSSISNSSPTTLEVLSTASSTDSSPGSMTPEITRSSTTDTELSVTSSPQELSTMLTPMTSTQELSTSSQNYHTESNTLQSSSLAEVTTSTPSLSPSVSTPTQTVSQGASSPDGITYLSTSSVSNMSPTTLEVFTAASSTVSTSGNTGHTSSMISQNSTSAITGVSMSNVPTRETTPITSPQELSTSLNKHTESMEVSSTPQTTLTNVTTSKLSPSSSGPTQTLTVSLGTSSSGEITIPSASSRSNSPPATSDILTTTDSASGDTGHTPAHVTGSLSVVTSRASSTTLSGQSTILLLSTSTQPSSSGNLSQSYHTTSMATSSVSSTSLLTEVTTENHSSSSPGTTVTDTLSHGTSSSGMTTNSPKTDSDRGTSLSATSVTLTSTTKAPRATLSPFPILPEQGISLFPYGTNSQVGDRSVFARTVDFTSSLFKLQIGFPLGSSLRDSFYFTDNGQIIFPESDYNIFSYPNPPQRGFTGREPVAMVAPFWADADFSSRGTIFYQAYDTLYGENHWLIREVETLIHKFTSDWSYKAKWTLKVTWVDVPAYPAQWSFGTSTYQAILSTDCSRSYALFLYQNGGMQWDVTQGLRNQVLMGFSSGDGYFENSPLTFRPAMEKYRPDRFLNSKLGIRGVQIYRLHRDVMPNYRVKCLQWLNSQPQRPSWSWSRNQVSCPCSWQQGLLDLRFWRVNTGSWGSSSWHLCTFSSWQGGMCCSYGRWGEFREGWRMHSPWQFEQEREAQQWCCHWNDKPAFCAQYYHMRPRVNCAWYRPPQPAWTYGDPHITTLDNVNYTFNGLGDFLLVQAQDTNSSFLLEGRTAQTVSARATNFIAFAAQYSTSSLASPITVQWFLEPNDTIRVLHNNQTVAFNTSNTDEGLPMFNTTGVLLTQNGSQVSANFDGTVTISVIALSNILHASSSLPEYYRNHTTGLLGVWNDNPHDDFRMPNGSTIPQNSSEEAIFHYGMTWQVNGTGLLGMRTDSPSSNFTPIFLSELLNTEDKSLTSGCSGDLQCKFDALATRKANIGQNTSTILKTFRRVNVTLNQYPPSINCSRDIQAYRGQTETFEITSDSKDITLNLVKQCSGFKLLENGSLQWTPTSPEACTLEILARDARTNLSSILQPRTVACFCSRENQCLYNETSREGNSSLEVTSCQCDGNTFGRFCERSRDHCEEPCFPNVSCIPGKGCEACPPNMTGDGRHCAALEDSLVCQTHSCPVNYCYNHGHCYISGAPDCQPTCTCPPAFTDSRCLLAGNSFTPTVSKDLPLRTIMLSLRENENASQADVNASVAYILGTLDMRAFLWNSLVDLTRTPPSAQPSDKSVQHWRVISHFQYRPRGPVIHFLNNQLIDAVVEAFLLQASRRQKRNSEEARKNVTFFPISRADVQDMIALDLSMLNNYFLCEGYKNYSLVYSPQNGVTCVSPCSEGYCHNEGQCQHLPDGPQCSCTSFTIYTSWGERCEHLSVKLGAFFGILFGALGALLLLGILAFAIFQLCGRSMNKFSYSLDSEL